MRARARKRENLTTSRRQKDVLIALYQFCTMYAMRCARACAHRFRFILLCFVLIHFAWALASSSIANEFTI